MSGGRFAFGPFVLDAEAGTLLREGKPVPVGYRGLLLLTAFLNRPGQVLTKSVLIDATWQGAAVEETNLSVQIASLRKLLGQASDGGDWIATVPRVGYRFIGAVQRQTDGPDGSAGASSFEQSRKGPSIAVLPFVNLSDDREQEYFADGMVEEIITGLARIRWLSVIARNSSFIYKGRAVDVRDVGRELGVGYVLEGGVRKAENRIRITAQLLETASGRHLWADRFEGALKDIFDLQDQITDKVVAVVEPNVQKSEIERSRRKRPENLDAYDLYLRAVPYTASQMPKDARVAMSYLQDALKIDPNFSAAHALIAWCHEWCFTRAGFHDEDKAAALAHARAALASGSDDATAIAVAGFVITMLDNDHEAGLSTTDRALALNPSCATAMYLGAMTNAFSGHPKAAEALADRAIQLSPFDLLTYQAHFARGFAAMQERRFAHAAVQFQKALEANPYLSSIYFCGAIALAMGGQIEAARALAHRGFQLEPGFRLRLFVELMVREVGDAFAEGGRLLNLQE